MKNSKKFLLIIFLFFLAGCIDSKEEFFLNPDGSGKVNVESKLTMQKGMFEGIGESGGTSLPMKVDFDNNIRQQIDSYKGIRAWKDVSCVKTEDGSILFKGIAYFDDISQVDKSKEGQEEMGGLISFSDKLVFEKQDNRTMVFKIKDKKSTAKKQEQKKLTEEEIAQKIMQQKQEAMGMQMMLGMFLSTLKMKRIIHLPGEIKEYSNFKKNEDNSLTIEFNGSEIMSNLGKVGMLDDSVWREQVLYDSGYPNAKSAVKSSVFGFKGEFYAKIEGKIAPLFDYRKEVKQAEIYFKELEKRLKSSNQNLSMGMDDFGHSSSIKTNFVKNVDMGSFDNTVTFDSKVTMDSTVSFDGRVKFDKDETKKSVNERNMYEKPVSKRVVSPVVIPRKRGIDLGFQSFNLGEKGTKYNSMIFFKGKDIEQGREYIIIKMDIIAKSINYFMFYNNMGERLSIKSHGYSAIGNEARFEFSITDKFPNLGSVELVLKNNK